MLAAENPVRAIPYARVSMAREESISPQIQMEAITAWAARNNRVLVGEPIIEEGKSGRDFKRRVMDAIERVEKGEAEEILVWKYSRFGRNTLQNAINVHRIEEAGGELVSVTEEVDASTATGGFTRDILFALGNMESRRIGEGWQEAQAIRLASGLPHTADPRFGYWHHKCNSQEVTSAGHRIRNVKDPECRPGPGGGPCREEFRVDPVTGPVLAEMYRRYINGASLATLVRWLVDTNVETAEDGRWNPSTVSGILDSGFGAGMLRVGGRGLPASDNTTRHLPGAQVPVIGADEWAAYLARRARMSGDASSTRYKWPLAGITRCGRCGGPMTCTTGGTGSQKGRGVRGYIMRCIAMQQDGSCKGLWRVTHAVEEALFARLDGLAESLEQAGRDAARTVPEMKSDRDKVKLRLHEEMGRAVAARKRLIEGVARGTFTFEEAAETRNELNDEIAALEAKITVAGAPARPWSPPQIRTIRADWARLSLETRRELVRTVVDRIVVHPDKQITVHLAAPLEALEMS